MRQKMLQKFYILPILTVKLPSNALSVYIFSPVCYDEIVKNAGCEGRKS